MIFLAESQGSAGAIKAERHVYHRAEACLDERGTGGRSLRGVCKNRIKWDESIV